MHRGYLEILIDSLPLKPHAPKSFRAAAGIPAFRPAAQPQDLTQRRSRLHPAAPGSADRRAGRSALCARGRGALPARRRAAGTAGSARQSDMRAHTHTFTPSPRSGAGRRGLGTSLATVYSRMGINRRRAGGSRQANASVCVCVLHASAHVWVCACARVFAPARARVGGRRPAAAATPSLRLRRRLGPRPS